MRKIANLSAHYKDLDQGFTDMLNIYRKNKAFARFLNSNIPFSIKGTYSFDDLGISCIRCFIYLDPEDKDSMIDVMNWIKLMKNQRFKVERFFRKDEGKFAIKLERSYSNYDSFIILIENGYDLNGCKITKKRKMQTVFETDCEMERSEL